MELGHRLKLFRVATGLKQTELAERLAVTKNYVYMVESGRREPSQNYLKKFAECVNIPLSVIFWNRLVEKTRNPKSWFSGSLL